MVETLVAISILTLSIAATFTAVQNGIRSSNIAKDETTAFYLAQEGMESIKNIRDQNALNSISDIPTNWLHGLSESTSDPCWYGGSGVSQKTCQIDAAFNTASICSSGVCDYIKYDSNSGLYRYTTGVDTTFKRTIQFVNVVAGTEIKVLMTISWVDRGTTRSFQFSESFFNRQ